MTGGVFGYSALSNMSNVIRGTLAECRRKDCSPRGCPRRSCASSLRHAGYLDSRDTTTRAEFQRLSWETHRVQREMNKRPGQIAQEVTLIASIDAKLSEIEIKYATAHRLADLGRDAAARRSRRASARGS